MARKHERTVPKKPNGRGFPRVKRSCGMVAGEWVGQINVSSGTDNPKLFHQLHLMLDDLYQRGESGVLVRIRDSVKIAKGGSTTGSGARHYEILEVYRNWKSNRDVPNIPGWLPLAQTMQEWLPNAETASSGRIAERTRRSYANNFRQLLKHAERMGISVPTDAELPRILRSFRKWCNERQHFVPFNQAKTACQSYARQTQREGKGSDLYRSLHLVAGLSTKRKRDRRILTVREVRELQASLPEREAQHVWNMIVLSIRPDEYANGQWEIRQHEEYGSYVQIHGTKTKSANRPVPLVEGVVKVQYADSTFRRALRKAVGDAVVPRDFRSTGKNWRKRADIDGARCKMYFAHSMGGLDDRYDTEDLLPHVAADAKLLQDYIRARDPLVLGEELPHAAA